MILHSRTNAPSKLCDIKENVGAFISNLSQPPEWQAAELNPPLKHQVRWDFKSQDPFLTARSFSGIRALSCDSRTKAPQETESTKQRAAAQSSSPKVHINTGILPSGSKARDSGEYGNHGMGDHIIEDYMILKKGIWSLYPVGIMVGCGLWPQFMVLQDRIRNGHRPYKTLQLSCSTRFQTAQSRPYLQILGPR